MLKTLAIVCTVVLSWIGLVSLMTEDRADLPMKKINKAISKIWKVEAFEVIDHNLNIEGNCNNNGCWFKVVTDDGELGMVYVGRVNSCRSGGCSIDPADETALSFEFFDYFMLADMNSEVLWVKVYNYQATQGHEVMSRGWLNQFIGLSPEKEIIFGEDVESISGATVSANAITRDIEEILACVEIR
jgi:hypothetical protein